MAAGLGIGVGQRADEAILVDAAEDVLDDRIVMIAESGGSDSACMHRVAHGGRRAAVARDRLDHHGGAGVVLAHAAELLRHEEAQQAVLGEDLEVLPREEQIAVALDGVGPHLLLAEIDELGLQRLLLVRQQPLRIELEAQTPEGLTSP